MASVAWFALDQKLRQFQHRSDTLFFSLVFGFWIYFFDYFPAAHMERCTHCASEDLRVQGILVEQHDLGRPQRGLFVGKAAKSWRIEDKNNVVVIILRVDKKRPFNQPLDMPRQDR